jgi:mono/diheme cytochrome c family protein
MDEICKFASGSQVDWSGFCTFFVSGVIFCTSLFSPAAADDEVQSSVDARRDYLFHCAICHGRDGRGGPAAGMLITVPPDLTEIASRNGGIFPYERVVRIIDGREMVASHGVREMPIWGTGFRAEEEQKAELYPRERKVRNRVRALADYLISLQAH